LGVSNVAGSGISFSLTGVLGIFLWVVAPLSNNLILSEIGVLPILERRDILIELVSSSCFSIMMTFWFIYEF